MGVIVDVIKQLMRILRADPCKKGKKKSAERVSIGSGISRICIPKIPVPPPPPPLGSDLTDHGGVAPLHTPPTGPNPVAGPKGGPARRKGGRKVGGSKVGRND